MNDSVSNLWTQQHPPSHHDQRKKTQRKKKNEPIYSCSFSDGADERGDEGVRGHRRLAWRSRSNQGVCSVRWKLQKGKMKKVFGSCLPGSKHVVHHHHHHHHKKRQRHVAITLRAPTVWLLLFVVGRAGASAGSQEAVPWPSGGDAGAGPATHREARGLQEGARRQRDGERGCLWSTWGRATCATDGAPQKARQKGRQDTPLTELSYSRDSLPVSVCRGLRRRFMIVSYYIRSIYEDTEVCTK